MAHPKKTYARVVALLDLEPHVGAYTVGREYEVISLHGHLEQAFMMVDDVGDRLLCWWHGDPDAVFERIERDV